MAFKRKLPMSEALRPGGAGMPSQSKLLKQGDSAFDLGSLKGPKTPKAPSGPTTLGQGVGTAAAKPPKPPKVPAMPSLPGIKEFKPPALKGSKVKL
jgi:hypothetical protein